MTPTSSLMKLTEASQRNCTETMRRGILPSKLTMVEHEKLRILVTEGPSENELDAYGTELAVKYGVKHLVRVCDPYYNAEVLNKYGIVVHDLSFPDGSAPSPKLIDTWLDLLDKVFYSEAEGEGSVVAIHCLAGLGRAPLMACIALRQYGMDMWDAVGYIRARRRGALNGRQLLFLEDYVPRKKSTEQVKPKRQYSLPRGLFGFVGNRKISQTM